MIYWAWLLRGRRADAEVSMLMRWARIKDTFISQLTRLAEWYVKNIPGHWRRLSRWLKEKKSVQFTCCHKVAKLAKLKVKCDFFFGKDYRFRSFNDSMTFLLKIASKLRLQSALSFWHDLKEWNVFWHRQYHNFFSNTSQSKSVMVSTTALRR